MKQGREHGGSPGKGQAAKGPELDSCDSAQGRVWLLLSLGCTEQDERLGLMDAKPEGSPRQVMVLILSIWAASSADRSHRSAKQCLRLPGMELGAAEARL